MKMTRWLSAAMTFAVYVSVVREAPAQGQGFQLDQFDPAERGSDWFSVESLDLRGSLRPAIGVVMDGAYRPLVIYAPDGRVRASVVRDQVFAHPGASLVLWERLRVGFDLPIAVYQDGHAGALNGVTYFPPETPSIGDLRLGADLRLVGIYGEPFTLALGARVYVPTGQRDNYTGDGTARIDGRLEAAGDLGVFTYAARVGAEYRNLQDTIGGSPLGSQLLFGAAAGFRAFDRALIVGPEVYGATIISSGDAVFATRSTPVDAVFGVHYTFLRDLRLGGGVGPGLTRGFGSPEVRWLASLEWVPAFEPPREPAPTPAPEPEPTPPPPADRDGDGVVDDDDACPDVAGVKTDDPKTNGCPPDRDHDGLVDSADACPDVAGVKTEDPKTNGCPPDPDRDKDGISNDQDACPDAPGPTNQDPKKNGCPAAAVVGKRIVILEQVKFATGSAKILPASDAILNAVLGVLNAHPEIQHVSIEGHTDSVGAAAMNKALSGARAASVMAWLVKHGVDPARLTSAGYGMERPVDTNETPEGRQNNRRVEFHLDDTEKKQP
jgi:outer membrane protein OmpA-like peptidoglycan-associated protein